MQDFKKNIWMGGQRFKTLSLENQLETQEIQSKKKEMKKMVIFS
jgi:hypothetical protein